MTPRLSPLAETLRGSRNAHRETLSALDWAPVGVGGAIWPGLRGCRAGRPTRYLEMPQDYERHVAGNEPAHDFRRLNNHTSSTHREYESRSKHDLSYATFGPKRRIALLHDKNGTVATG